MSQHPITPPPELANKIFGDALRGNSGQHDYELRLIHAAYAAGADQELEACVEWLENQTLCGHRELIPSLRRLRRPKPPSLKEQALEAIGRLCASVIHDDLKDDAAIVRRALEALDD